MAETTTLRAIQDVTVTFSDDTGTPKTYVFKLTEGTITIEDGFYNVIVPTEASGAPISGAAARAAGVGGMCGFTVSGKLFDTGANASEGVYIDLVRNDGYAGASWTMTKLSPDSDLIIGGIWDVAIAVGNVGSGAEAKGTTYTFGACRKEGGARIEITRDGGAMISGDTWRSLELVHYTTARLS